MNNAMTNTANVHVNGQSSMCPIPLEKNSFSGQFFSQPVCRSVGKRPADVYRKLLGSKNGFTEVWEVETPEEYAQKVIYSIEEFHKNTTEGVSRIQFLNSINRYMDELEVQYKKGYITKNVLKGVVKELENYSDAPEKTIVSILVERGPNIKSLLEKVSNQIKFDNQIKPYERAPYKNRFLRLVKEMAESSPHQAKALAIVFLCAEPPLTVTLSRQSKKNPYFDSEYNNILINVFDPPKDNKTLVINNMFDGYVKNVFKHLLESVIHHTINMNGKTSMKSFTGFEVKEGQNTFQGLSLEQFQKLTEANLLFSGYSSFVLEAPLELTSRQIVDFYNQMTKEINNVLAGNLSKEQILFVKQKYVAKNRYVTLDDTNQRYYKSGDTGYPLSVSWGKVRAAYQTNNNQENLFVSVDENADSILGPLWRLLDWEKKIEEPAVLAFLKDIEHLFKEGKNKMETRLKTIFPQFISTEETLDTQKLFGVNLFMAELSARLCSGRIDLDPIFTELFPTLCLYREKKIDNYYREKLVEERQNKFGQKATYESNFR